MKLPVHPLMWKHFQTVAKKYRHVRTTDLEPILAIKKLLGARASRPAADVACGAGRYTRLFAQILKPKFLVAADANRAMLAECRSYLSQFPAKTKLFFTLSLSQELPLAAGVLGYLITFNAVHHFRLPLFLAEAARVLEAGGLLFIYTRLRDQNRRTVWGEFFPGFAEKEGRLFSLGEIEKAVARTGRFAFKEIRFFKFRRRSSRRELQAQAASRHYSTFCFYTPAAFARGLKKFNENLKANFPDHKGILHTSENVLLVLEKTG
ncbi:MAG: class I SAM-dependent methyltransferase [candidate division Zixibacteria bacterium]|nr:class I SAM-dependent methyltransferase [candidate division Zixibacteria bacterium]